MLFKSRTVLFIQIDIISWTNTNVGPFMFGLWYLHLLWCAAHSIYQKQYCGHIGRGALDIKYQQENLKKKWKLNIRKSWLKNWQISLKYNLQNLWNNLLPSKLNNFGRLELGMSLNFLFRVWRRPFVTVMAKIQHTIAVLQTFVHFLAHFHNNECLWKFNIHNIKWN